MEDSRAEETKGRDVLHLVEGSAAAVTKGEHVALHGGGLSVVFGIASDYLEEVVNKDLSILGNGAREVLLEEVSVVGLSCALKDKVEALLLLELI